MPNTKGDAPHEAPLDPLIARIRKNGAKKTTKAKGASRSSGDVLRHLLYDHAMVTLKVGLERTQFTIQRGVLCAQSSYFDKCLNGPWTETTEGFVLEDVHVEIFRIFQAWVLTGRLVYIPEKEGIQMVDVLDVFDLVSTMDADRPSTWDWMILVDLYIAGDRFDVPMFRAQVIDTIVAKKETIKHFPPLALIRYVGENLPDHSPLMTPLGDVCAYHASQHSTSWELWKTLPPVFLARVAYVNTVRLPRKLCKKCYRSAIEDNPTEDVHACSRQDVPRWEANTCYYHQHASEREKKACRKARERRAAEEFSSDGEEEDDDNDD